MSWTKKTRKCLCIFILYRRKQVRNASSGCVFACGWMAYRFIQCCTKQVFIVFSSLTCLSRVFIIANYFSLSTNFYQLLTIISALVISLIVSKRVLNLRPLDCSDTCHADIKIAQLKADLAALLKKRILPPSLSHAYPTRCQDHDLLARFSTDKSKFRLPNLNPTQMATYSNSFIGTIA